MCVFVVSRVWPCSDCVMVVKTIAVVSAALDVEEAVLADSTVMVTVWTTTSEVYAG